MHGRLDGLHGIGQGLRKPKSMMPSHSNPLEDDADGAALFNAMASLNGPILYEWHDDDPRGYVERSAWGDIDQTLGQLHTAHCVADRRLNRMSSPTQPFVVVIRWS